MCVMETSLPLLPPEMVRHILSFLRSDDLIEVFMSSPFLLELGCLPGNILHNVAISDDKITSTFHLEYPKVATVGLLFKRSEETEILRSEPEDGLDTVSFHVSCPNPHTAIRRYISALLTKRPKTIRWNLANSPSSLLHDIVNDFNLDVISVSSFSLDYFHDYRKPSSSTSRDCKEVAVRICERISAEQVTLGDYLGSGEHTFFSMELLSTPLITKCSKLELCGPLSFYYPSNFMSSLHAHSIQLTSLPISQIPQCMDIIKDWLTGSRSLKHMSILFAESTYSWECEMEYLRLVARSEMWRCKQSLDKSKCTFQRMNIRGTLRLHSESLIFENLDHEKEPYFK